MWRQPPHLLPTENILAFICLFFVSEQINTSTSLDILDIVFGVRSFGLNYNKTPAA